jgi:hypothetical protein
MDGGIQIRESRLANRKFCRFANPADLRSDFRWFLASRAGATHLPVREDNGRIRGRTVKKSRAGWVIGAGF